MFNTLRLSIEVLTKVLLKVFTDIAIKVIVTVEIFIEILTEVAKSYIITRQEGGLSRRLAF